MSTNYVDNIEVEKVVVSKWIDVEKQKEEPILNKLKNGYVDDAVTEWRNVHYTNMYTIDFNTYTYTINTKSTILNILDTCKNNTFSIIQQDIRPGNTLARVNKTNRIVTVYYSDGTVVDIVNRDLLDYIESIDE